jgi:predicted ArsR family transcriptional regulator
MAYERDTLAVLEEDLAAGDFHPGSTPHAQGRDFVLGRCPFVEVTATDPATVCQLHLGLAEGVAAELGQGAVIDLVAKDPRWAGCRLGVRIAEDSRPASA